MRPVKELFFEEYWNIAFRAYTDEDSVVNGKSAEFELLKANKRFWYADPFLFEKDSKTYLFVEMFDNKTEVGVIGCSEFVNGKFTQPQVVLEEKFHLSYPYVFESYGKIFMMPETHEDNCIQLYEAVEFPTKWKKSTVLVNNISAVDTVEENGLLLTSRLCPDGDMSVDLCVYDKGGNEKNYSPVNEKSFIKRGAGKTFSFNGMRMRPAQNCEGKNYGGGLIFYKINQCDETAYSEENFSESTPEKILTSINKQANGIHTYARTNKIEIVDIKFERINLKRFFWIIKKKIF